VAADGPEAAWSGQHRWQALEDAGYAIGELAITVRDVYTGESLPWYQRLANALHADTDPEVVRSLLTVGRGEPVRAQRIYEAERQLRRQDFLIDARIVPRRCADGRVDAEVRVRDAWTLQVGGGIGSAGGESTGSFGFSDDNLLGTGKAVFVNWSQGRERTTRELRYHDPALAGSDWTLDLTHQERSDGGAEVLAVGYPFRRSDQAWGLRAAAESSRRDLQFEQDSRRAYEARLESRGGELEARWLLSRSDGHGWRAGAGWRVEQAEYGSLEVQAGDLRPPPRLADRDLQGPYVLLERFPDRHRSFRNLQAIGLTEDYEVGLDARARLGRYRNAEGAEDPWFAHIEVDYAAALGERDLLRARLEASGRHAGGDAWSAWYRSLAADYYHRLTRRNTLVGHVELDWRDRADPEDELYIGGFDGLLAYPDRFRVGDRRWLTHLESRHVSDWVLFDTIQVGYTAYLEAGAVRGLDGEWSRTLANLGGGFRLGSLRSSFGAVSYVTVATPLVDAGQEDGYAFVVGTTVNF
jgi:hemolysin activation/secretion protein